MTRKIILLTLASLIFVAIIFVCLAIYEEARPEKYYTLGIALSIAASLLIYSLLVWNKGQWLILPSLIPLLLFLVIPPIGARGYYVFMSVHGPYEGVGLIQDYPTLIWYLGTLFFVLGLYGGHVFRVFPRQNSTVTIRLDRLRVCLFIFGVVSVGFTALAIFKLGGLPVFMGLADANRFQFSQTVGSGIVKYSRLWVLVFAISSVIHLFYRKSTVLVVLMACSGLFLSMYGQRQYVIGLLSFLFLLMLKRGQKQFLFMTPLYLLVAIALYFLVGFMRGDMPTDSLAFHDILNMKLFSEWKEYCYAVNKFQSQANLLGNDLFIGAVAALVPKEIFAIVGINKGDLLAYNAANYFGQFFGHYAGIRVCLIGELFCAYGMTGVLITMLILGGVFAKLERFFMSLAVGDARLLLMTYIISIILILPLVTPISLFNQLSFFGFFFIIVTLFCGQKVPRRA